MWHREWKSRFPASWAEIPHKASDGEIHRADIKTPQGLVVEVQHSAMSDAERNSREQFYKNMIWIIDGRGFSHNFDIYHKLPRPDSELAADIVWIKATRSMQGAARGIFFRLSDSDEDEPSITKKTLTSGLLHFIHEIERDILKEFQGHHQYDWVRPRKTWLDSNCPVYIDFGWECLVKLSSYDDYELPCVVLVPKEQFIHDVMTLRFSSEICEVPSELWSVRRD